MIKKIVLPLLLIAISISAIAQTEKLEKKLYKLRYGKLDTTYIAPPAKKFFVAAGYRYTSKHNNFKLPYDLELEKYTKFAKQLEPYENIKVNSSSYGSNIFIRGSYLGFAIGYSQKLAGSGERYAFELASNGNKFGFRVGTSRSDFSNATFYDYRNVILMAIFAEALGAETIDVSDIDKYCTYHNYEGFKDIVNWYANGYYAFNNKKFSMGAARYASYIQRRSAGSFFVTGDINYNRIHAGEVLYDRPDDESGNTENENYNIRENYNAFAIALGGGYGYNWTPNHGKLLVHGSIMPNINVYSYMHTTFYKNGKELSGKELNAKEQPAMRTINDNKMKFAFGGVARLAVIYNISDRVTAGTNAEYTMRNCKNASDYKTYYDKLQINAYVGLRF